MVRPICRQIIHLKRLLNYLLNFIIRFQVNWKQLGLGMLYGFALGWAMVYFLDFTDKRFDYKLEPNEIAVFTGDFDQYKNTSMADELMNKVRILCWMRIYEHNYNAIDKILRTWEKRCNKMLFFSNATYPNLPLIKLKFDGHSPFGYTKVALTYLIKNKILDEYDWILNTLPDMYVVMENLRYVLQVYNPNKKYHFSATFRENQAPEFLAEKAGYVFSRAAAESFYKIAVMRQVDKTREFPFIPWTEFVSQFVTVDTDLLACSRQPKLLPKNFEIIEWQGGKFLCLEDGFFNGHEYLQCCTNNFISFHKCRPKQIFVLEFYIYGVKPYGIAINYNRNNETSIHTIEQRHHDWIAQHGHG